jgi:ABC-type polysaccharide/polyol phosphate transport system, ATPase component
MGQDVAIQVQNLSKVYRLYNRPLDRLKESLHPLRKRYSHDFYALHNASFAVKKGETVGIIGKNGSGKSTLLKIITGVLTATTGTVQVVGKVSALLELGAGFNPEMTGIENVYLSGVVMGYGQKEIDDKLEEILAFADIGDYVYQPVKTYSSGMFVRLAFAVAINVDPDILIVDEALSVGDMAFQAKCYRRINEFQGSGKTILLVTHSMDSILKYCQRTIVLDEGQLIDYGNSKEMVDVYKKLLVRFKKPHAGPKAVAIEQGRAWKDNFKINESYLEYGDKQAEIIDYGIFAADGKPLQIIISDQLITVKMKIRINQDISEPIYAFAIKDLKGNELVGTNTALAPIDTGCPYPGHVIQISFTQRLNLQCGHYSLSLGCTCFATDEILTIYHRLYDILYFEVISEKRIFGLFDVHSEIEIQATANS